MEQAREVSREEFTAWKADKVTQFLMGVLEERKKELVESVTTGGTLGPDCTLTALNVGRIQMLDELLKIEYEEKAQYEY